MRTLLILAALLLSSPFASASDTAQLPAQAALEACPDALPGITLAQVDGTDCCKGKKGICGCRAGKIVCCDSSTSKETGCTCHGDEGIVE